MSSRRSRLTSSRITVDERIDDLVSKLHSVLPGQGRIRSRGRRHDKVSTLKALQEICSYIRSLQLEMDDLSERLSELFNTSDISTAQAASIRSLINCMNS
ncbi:transcription factor ILI6-like [Zingiber officinale]|uniref:transcription factor ILI6-like n=1 Tax=Zingiber officinale TaxID=94328 RepID=UPI001C4D08EE|nr:transcription factor ILI6-like [Zingiber officinale]